MASKHAVARFINFHTLTMRIKQAIQESIALKEQLLGNEAMLQLIDDVTETIAGVFKKGGQVLFCGNGGSAADAQHLAAEFSGRYYFDRPPLNAEALHVNSSYLTAVANDYSYDEIFARLVRAKGKAGDLLIGLSTSGNSGNVVNALETARSINMQTIAFTGQGGGEARKWSDYLFAIPSHDTPRVQEVHMLIGHIICEQVESKLFKHIKNKR